MTPIYFKFKWLYFMYIDLYIFIYIYIFIFYIYYCHNYYSVAWLSSFVQLKFKRHDTKTKAFHTIIILQKSKRKKNKNKTQTNRTWVSVSPVERATHTYSNVQVSWFCALRGNRQTALLVEIYLFYFIFCTVFLFFKGGNRRRRADGVRVWGSGGGRGRVWWTAGVQLQDSVA